MGDNIKELLPGHDRIIDLLEQRCQGTPTEAVMDEDEKENGPEEPEKHTKTPSKKRNRFTPEEDDKILEGYSKYGTEWDNIIAFGKLDRTAVQISARYRRLAKKSTSKINEEHPSKHRKMSHKEQNGEGPGQPAVKNELSNSLDSDPTKTAVNPQENALKEREEDLRKYEQRLIDREKKLAQDEHIRNLPILETPGGRSLVERLRAGAAAERREARRHVSADNLRVGGLRYVRHGPDFVEQWCDGDAFLELQHRCDRLDKIREDLKKQMAKKKTAGKEAGGELLNLDEIITVRKSEMKREEAEIKYEKEKLNIQKILHIRELQRIQDEEGSRFKELPVLRQQYLLLTLLGRGGFSEVFKAFDLICNRHVACKIHSLNPLWHDAKKQNYIKHAIREYNIHKTLEHPRVVRLFDVFEIDENSFCTVLEYCEGGDFDIYLKTAPTVSEKDARAIMVQIFTGLKYLNEQKRPIIHYDLKPGNILFSNGEVKITDFGLSKIMEEESSFLELTSQGAGTYWYLPPECFETEKEGPPKISSKVDVWSAGVIFYQMLYGKKPFGNNLSQQKILADSVIQNARSVDFPAKPPVSLDTKEFIRRCLSHQQKERPDVFTCCNDSHMLMQTQIKKEKHKKE